MEQSLQVIRRWFYGIFNNFLNYLDKYNSKYGYFISGDHAVAVENILRLVRTLD